MKLKSWAVANGEKTVEKIKKAVPSMKKIYIEDIDDEKHDRVDQGNTRDGCLPDPGDHDGVGKTDGDL